MEKFVESVTKATIKRSGTEKFLPKIPEKFPNRGPRKKFTPGPPKALDGPADRWLGRAPGS
jgi:hypothetical protein